MRVVGISEVAGGGARRWDGDATMYGVVLQELRPEMVVCSDEASPSQRSFTGVGCQKGA